MQASGTGVARTDDRETNEIQVILIRSVEMQKILDEMQNILHLRLLNPKDFDRGCRNAKDFAIAAHTYKIFSILCACADSCVLTLVCMRRLLCAIVCDCH
jgi:hypothetical protein